MLSSSWLVRIVTEIAIVGCAIPVMARHAIGHRDRLLLAQRIPFRDRTMAFRTVHFGLLRVALMREIDGTRQPVDADPRDRFLLRRESCELLNRGGILPDRYVATHADTFSRKSRRITRRTDRMAIE